MASFDIEDRKGLEIVILTALLTFQDSSDVYHTPREGSPTSNSMLPVLGSRKTSEGPPLRPPKPAPKTGVERIAEMQALRREVNEVTVDDEGSVNDYAQYCVNLLQVGNLCRDFVCQSTELSFTRTKPCFLSRFAHLLLPTSPRFFKLSRRLNVYDIKQVCF